MSAHPEVDAPAEPRWRRYLRFWRADSRGDIDDELRFHIDMRARDYRAAGHSPEDARRLAMERFGNARDVRAECEEAARVSSALFPLLGANARLGRTVTADDERPGATAE